MADVEVQDLGGATVQSVLVNGFVHPAMFKSADVIQNIFDNAPNLTFRDDDVMLLTFAKTGTNWMYEILSMVLNKSSDPVTTIKLQTMIELCTIEDMDKLPSIRRVMNTHYPYRYLPVKGLREKQTQTVLCLRNPKDVAVSYYNHMKGLAHYKYDGKWSNWLPVYMQGKFEYGMYTDYLKELETAIKEDSIGFPLHVMYYEDLKSTYPRTAIKGLPGCKAKFPGTVILDELNGLEELDKLVKFLDIELEPDLKKAIMDKCGFEKMAANKVGPELQKKFFKDGFSFFRKGEVGNWKEWFTVAQSEEFDEYWKKEMDGYDMFQFKYTL